MKNVGLKEKQVLSLSYGRIIVKPIEKLRGLIPDSFETYQIVEPGDLIVRPTDLQNDMTSLRVGYVNDRGIITSAYICLQVTDAVIPQFGYQMLNTYDLSKVFYGMGSGLRQNLEWADFKRMWVFVPPHDEQSAIVRFLADANQRLDKAIRAKRKTIALLNEQKQVVIDRSVTRGLNANVQSRQCNFLALNSIPAHWDTSALRRYWQVTDCKHLTVPFTDGGIPLASVVEVRNFSLNLVSSKKTSKPWYEKLIEGGRKPKRGDIIYCRNASVGSSALVDTDEDFAMGQDVCLIRSSLQNQRFLNYVLHSAFMKHQLELILVGSTFKRINVSEIKALAVLIPPRSEQDDICRFLDAELASYDKARERLEAEILLLREYRTRLIADIVTGKLDVREAAARLPIQAPAAMKPVDTPDDTDLDEPAEDLVEAEAGA